MHQFVIKKVSWRKTLQTYGHCRKCRTHKPCQQRHRCLSPCLPWTWRPFCTKIFRLCVLVSCLCWLSSRIARWFPVSQRHRRHLSMRDRDRPMRRPVNTKGVMEEKRPHVRSREEEPQIALTVDLPNEGTSSLSEFGADTAPPAVDVADKTSRRQVPHSQFRGHLFDKQYRARTPAQSGWTKTIFWRTNAAQTTGLSRKGFLLQELIFAHCNPRPTIQGNLMSTLCPSWKVPDQ